MALASVQVLEAELKTLKVYILAFQHVILAHAEIKICNQQDLQQLLEEQLCLRV